MEKFVLEGIDIIFGKAMSDKSSHRPGRMPCGLQSVRRHYEGGAAKPRVI
jgi:hypothetical protein